MNGEERRFKEALRHVRYLTPQKHYSINREIEDGDYWAAQISIDIAGIRQRKIDMQPVATDQ